MIIKYKQYTVQASGYKYCIVNSEDEHILDKIRQQFPGVTVMSDKCKIFMPHMVVDIGGSDIMHIYTRIKYKLSYVFNEYMILRKAPKVFMLKYFPKHIYEGTYCTCTLCGKKIRGYYITGTVCLECASSDLLDSSVLYYTPKYDARPIEKRGNILTRGTTAYIFGNEVQNVGIINYLVQNKKVLDDMTEIYLYNRHMESTYLEYQKNEYTFIYK